MKTDFLIIGAGISGITLAERLAAANKKILIVEKRNHIGGNCYDYKDKDGILIHKYGPHIFHTNYKEVRDYLSQFTGWINYQHKVLGLVDNKLVPIPFNLNTLHKLFAPKDAQKLEERMIKRFGYDKKISILELKKVKDKELEFLANYIYQKIFLGYTKKHWGLKPEEIDPSVTARVPVIISRDDRYFHDRYQGIPKKGYTEMFKKMLKNKNIRVQLNTDYKSVKNKLEYNMLFYTGPIDEFFEYKFGKLEYRCLKIEFLTFHQKSFQLAAVINYPSLKYPFTRITEFKKVTNQENKKTVIGKEFPGKEGFIAWPVLDEKNKRVFQKYWQEAEKLKKENIYFIGRLAEYRYYNMDEVVKNSLDFSNFLLKTSN